MVKVPKEMRRMREAEGTFRREVSRAQLREFVEHMRWIQRRPFRRARRAAFSASRGAPTEEKFRPSSSNYLHVLAKDARDGNYEAYETFIKSLGLEATEDTIAAAHERFRVAFRPEGPNVHEWWRDSSEDAREWLCAQVRRGPKEQAPSGLDLANAEANINYADLHILEDPDLVAFIEAEDQRAKEAELRAIVKELPERQHQYLMLRAEGLKYEEIAQEMGVDLSTVKSHARALRENPDLRRLRKAW